MTNLERKQMIVGAYLKLREQEEVYKHEIIMLQEVQSYDGGLSHEDRDSRIVWLQTELRALEKHLDTSLALIRLLDEIEREAA